MYLENLRNIKYLIKLKELYMQSIDYSEDDTIFKTSVPVLVNHLNYANHLGYDSLLSILQEARISFLKKNEMTEINIHEHVGYQVLNVSVEYKSEAFHGDILDVELYICEASKRKFTFKYKVLNNRTNKIVAVAETGHLFFNFELKKIGLMPENFSN